MNTLSNFFTKLLYKLVLKNFKPEIIPYKDSKGKIIYKTRVSNLTHISYKENIVLGENVFIGHFNYLDGNQKITIEKGCQITNYVNIVTHSSHNAIRELKAEYIERINESESMVKGEIFIGEYTYIGPHTVIAPGTTIGKNCIIGAFSYVSGNIPDNSIIKGLPAKISGQTNQVNEL